MTRKSKREIERLLDDVETEAGSGPEEIVIQETVIATSWGDNEHEPGTVIDEETTVVEL